MGEGAEYSGRTEEKKGMARNIETDKTPNSCERKKNRCVWA